MAEQGTTHGQKAGIGRSDGTAKAFTRHLYTWACLHVKTVGGLKLTRTKLKPMKKPAAKSRDLKLIMTKLKARKKPAAKLRVLKLITTKSQP